MHLIFSFFWIQRRMKILHNHLRAVTPPLPAHDWWTEVLLESEIRESKQRVDFPPLKLILPIDFSFTKPPSTKIPSCWYNTQMTLNIHPAHPLDTHSLPSSTRELGVTAERKVRGWKFIGNHNNIIKRGRQPPVYGCFHCKWCFTPNTMSSISILEQTISSRRTGVMLPFLVHTKRQRRSCHPSTKPPFNCTWL